jgi:hypothetical protein
MPEFCLSNVRGLWYSSFMSKMSEAYLELLLSESETPVLDRLVDLSTHPEACWCQECDPDFYFDLEVDWLVPDLEPPF